MKRILLIQPGATEFDEQGRIKGCLDLPLSSLGLEQAGQIALDLTHVEFDTIYTAPCQSALQTAAMLAVGRKVRVKTINKLKNLDHGLWHGKRVAEVREKQPKVYRQCQESPEMVCPPDGEPVAAAAARAQLVLNKIMKRHKDKCVALVIPEPLATIVSSYLQKRALEEFWGTEQDCGKWTSIEIGVDDPTAVG